MYILPTVPHIIIITIRLVERIPLSIMLSLVTISFLTRECAHAHERVIAIMAFSLGRLVGRLVGSVVNFRACAVNEF